MTTGGAGHIRQAVVLAGGLGTRLGALTATTPKPLLPVAGRPFLDALMVWLAHAGVDQVILSTGYLAGTFAEFIAEGRDSGRWTLPTGDAIDVVESREDRPLGTAGALSLLRGQLDPRFFLINGDSLFLCDPVAVATRAEALPHGHSVLTIREVPDTARFGRVETAATDAVTGFREKGVEGTGWINAGVSVLSRDVLDLIATLPCSIETDIYPVLAARGLLHAVRQTGYFIDIGLPETYTEAQTTLPRAQHRPAVFFDRDGVLNRDDAGYTYRTTDLTLVPGAGRAVALARSLGYTTIVVTNQAGIARGLYTEADMSVFHGALNDALRQSGGWIDAFYHCPYHPQATLPQWQAENHPDRKPNPGMLMRAARDLDIDLAGSVLFGDRDSDILAARSAGLRGVLYIGGNLDALLGETLRHGGTSD